MVHILELDESRVRRQPAALRALRAAREVKVTQAARLASLVAACRERAEAERRQQAAALGVAI